MLTLFTYRFIHPVYRQWTTLDCAAVSREAALASAQRFLRRENRRLRRCGISPKIRRFAVPNHLNDMRVETG